MTTQLSRRQMVAECLRNGAQWKRSLHMLAATVNAMIADGEVHAVSPEGGRGKNMVELTGRGWAAYFGENLIVSRLDRFAELLSEGFTPMEAGRELFLTRGQIARSMQDITRQLGAQAA